MRGVGLFQLAFRFDFLGRIPGLFFGGREHWFFTKEGSHAIGAHFGRRMQPAKGPHAGITAGQSVLACGRRLCGKGQSK